MSDHASRLPLHVLFVFLDGVGLGDELPDSNPLFQLTLSAFEQLGKEQSWTNKLKNNVSANHVVRPIDACLDVEGLPQSGTGQATLFTGINCAEAAGRHFGPYPHSTSKPILSAHNIFSQVQRLFPSHYEPAAFANAYPPVFFKHAEARNRWSVTTYSCIEANLPIRRTDDVQNGTALTAELTGKAWVERLGIDIDPISEKEAGRRLVQLSQNYPFTLFEYFLTDKAGHSQTFSEAERILTSLNQFFTGILHSIDINNTLLIITSDHGNIEDLSTRSHTTNMVPLIAYGKGAAGFADAGSILDVTPLILETLASLNSTS